VSIEADDVFARRISSSNGEWDPPRPEIPSDKVHPEDL
jgi:hypothetical protein